MPTTIEPTDLDNLIGDLDTRITETELPSAQAYTEGCSGVCTVIVCDTVLVCSGVIC
ncbi:hypothetical protein MUU72_23630 [Streptomyces sp. RS10V-4]|uniref:hypothetical protein n=1 Tax=Streptomyces rhizoryzae TaxID=2932493 RepID=UPI002002FB0D|nr:hypothetical protein [Streptomyces rhizoryzae]MCK7626060.1 hypothetical protein [Streptomyces rhizoryzae]